MTVLHVNGLSLFFIFSQTFRTCANLKLGSPRSSGKVFISLTDNPTLAANVFHSDVIYLPTNE